jgi:hypothetical protein
MIKATKIIESINTFVPEVGTGILSTQIGDLSEGTKITYIKTDEGLSISEVNSTNYFSVMPEVYSVIKNKVDISNSDYDKVLG